MGREFFWRHSACHRVGKQTIALLTTGLLAGPVPAQNTAANDFFRHPGASDPGPRPVGNQVVSVKGAIFNVGFPDSFQPKDADGNGAGRQLPKLTTDQTAFWFASLVVFAQQATVDGASDPTTNNPTLKGLGPAYNADSCGICHAFPALGGTSPPVNPQIALAKAKGAQNSIPPFLSLQGPVREARFVAPVSDGLPKGAVRPLFTITGRSDTAPGCNLQQPDFASQFRRGNVVFRIPTPTFGVGYIENTSDEVLEKTFAGTQSKRARMGISGHFNTNGNDQSITRFGWKAQNESLLLFSGEAANVEMGLTNELFTNERSVGNGCDVHALPEDVSNIVPFDRLTSSPGPGDAASLVGSGIINFGVFMRLNAAPSQCAFDSGVDSTGAAVCKPFTASPKAASITNGQAQFRSVGCALCHTETLTTGPSPFESLSNATYHPYSDFAVHGMGRGLADGVVQGAAAGDEYRTAPLWGLGQRVFFLHDGRTSDLVEAIAAHRSSESEANEVIRNFNGLSDSQKQDVLNFLRSL